MRIAFNLAIPASAHERYALYWAPAATLLGGIGLALILTVTVRSYHDYKAVQQSVVVQREAENALRAQEMATRRDLDQPQARQLLSDTQVINVLIERRRISVTSLVADIAGLVPDEVRLAELDLAPDEQGLGVRFVITGKSEAALDRFLSNMEDSPHFKDVAVTNQGFEEVGAGSELPNIACTARYLNSRNESSGE
jgi:hypothetical protein